MLKEKKKAKTPWDRFVEKYVGKGIKQGIKEGKIEGIKEGKIEGIKEGKIEGIKEGKLEIARRMLAKNLTIDEITDLTGLTKEQILSLQPSSR